MIPRGCPVNLQMLAVKDGIAKRGKPVKTVELAAFQLDGWRNIPWLLKNSLPRNSPK